MVGLIEDTSWPDEDWCAAALSASPIRRRLLREGRQDRSGAAQPVPGAGLERVWRLRGNRLPRPASGSFQDQPAAASRVPGNNMAFRRVDLIDALGDEGIGLFEGPLCTSLLAKGRRVVYHPGMSVTYAVCDQHNASLAMRLHHGRIYAAERVRGRAWPSRLAHLEAALLPIVLTARAMGSLGGSSA
jgi:hypothetical protein